jgi:hypothetical protein
MKIDRKNRMGMDHLQDEKLNKIHKEELGLDLPEGYFAQSKNEILMKTTNDTNSHTVNWFLHKNNILKIAASIVLVVGISVYFQFSSTTISGTNESSVVEIDSSNEINQSLVQSDSNQDNKNSELIMSNSNKQIEHQKTKVGNVVQNENDILVKSLFVEDAEVDKYIESSILEDI